MIQRLPKALAAARPRGAMAIVTGGLAVAMLCAATPDASGHQSCRPKRPLPPAIAKSMGPCAYNPDTASYAGEPAQQAACLLRPVGKLGRLGPTLENLPAVLANRVGRPSELPDREALRALLSELGLERDFGAHLSRRISRARDDDVNAPSARYLVIHDTSGPNIGRKPWPQDMDHNRKINRLARFRCADGWESAHVFVNRPGAMLLGHDFEVPWRGTKFERATRFGTDLKGLFLHVELVQPRRRDPRRGRRNDALAPTPGFTPAQYDRLALLYVVASVRAGNWLIPAFHAVIDAHMRNGHDDPQNFDLAAFARSLETLIDRLRKRDEPVVSSVP